MDVISFGPDKPRRPLPRPPRRTVVAGVAAIACAALLVVGIMAVRHGGDSAPSGAAQPSTAAAPPDAAATRASNAAVPPSNQAAAPSNSPAVPGNLTARQCSSSSLTIPGLAIDGVPLGTGRTVIRCDGGAVTGPWTVVVRRHDGSLANHGAVVTFPVAAPSGGRPVTVNGAPGKAITRSVTWPLAKAYARIRGDLDQATLLAVARRTTVSGGRPRVRPPAGYAVVWSGPYRAPDVHEVRYGSQEVGEAAALGSGLTYTGITNGGGGFEDQLYLSSSAGGLVGGVPTVLSGVGGGNATLAWELEPGTVAYVGYSGAQLDDEAAAALRRLAARARLMSREEWWFSQPQTVAQVNEPG